MVTLPFQEDSITSSGLQCGIVVVDFMQVFPFLQALLALGGRIYRYLINDTTCLISRYLQHHPIVLNKGTQLVLL